MEFRILAVGDVVGTPGLNCLRKHLPALRKKPLLCLLGSFVALFHTQLIAYAFQVKNLLLGSTAVFALPDRWQLIQLFALAALPLILLYNGKKGKTPASSLGKQALQWGFYLFYPVHMMILHLIA